MIRRVFNQSQREAFSHFASHASIDALTHIQDDKTKRHRIAWTIVFVTAVLICIHQLVGISSKYLAYSVRTDMSVVYQNPLDFPSVTICGLNPVKFGALKSMKSAARPPDESKAQKKASDDLSALFDPPEATRADKKRRQRLTRLLSQVHGQVAKNLTHDMKDFLIDCAFGARNCVPSDFVSFDSPRYGNCFVFNSGRNAKNKEEPLRRAYSSGVEDSLEMTLFVDQGNYLPSDGTAGFKVIVHDQGEPPVPEDEGVVISPGYFSSFGLTKRTLVAASPPYGNCRHVSKADNISMNMYLLQLPLTRPSLKACTRTCEQRLVMENCGCYSPRHGFQNSAAFQKSRKSSTPLAACDVEDSLPSYRCMQNVLRKKSVSECKHFCDYKPCVKHDFVISRSASFWPSLNTMASLKDTLKKHPNPSIKSIASSDDFNVRANFLKLQIYFQELSVTLLTTEPSYDHHEFVADIGGVTGLWIGLSLFTIFDVLELVIDLICSIGKPGPGRHGKAALKAKQKEEHREEKQKGGEEDLGGKV